MTDLHGRGCLMRLSLCRKTVSAMCCCRVLKWAAALTRNCLIYKPLQAIALIRTAASDGKNIFVKGRGSTALLFGLGRTTAREAKWQFCTADSSADCFVRVVDARIMIEYNNEMP